MKSREEILLIYILIIIGIYFWENIIIGNITASTEQDKGKFYLPLIIKKILFPLFYIKKFAFILLIYQAFNFCLLILMILIGIFGNCSFIQNVLGIYLKFQTYYWWISIILIDGYFYIIKMKRALNIRRLRKNKEDNMFNILREMNAKTFELNGDIILATQLSTNIKGYIFIIVGNEDYLIPDVEFKEIIDDLSKMNYLLIYIKRYLSDDIEKTVSTIKESVQFFDQLYNCEKVPIYFIGRQASGICDMLYIYDNYKSITGMIWICFSTEKAVKKSLYKILNNSLSDNLKQNERNICTVQINKKDSLEKLNVWLEQHD